MKQLAIFASGTGSNFDAIVKSINYGEIPAKAVLLVCDKVGAPVIEKAKAQGIETFVFTAKEFASKEAYEAEILAALKKHKVEWIALAGYMRLIGDTLLKAYEGHIINVHPSLLPKYKGKDAIERAFEAGDKTIGITIHYVDSGMDTGEIIAQESIELTGDESLEDVTQKIHQVEHKLYPQTLAKLLKQ